MSRSRNQKKKNWDPPKRFAKEEWKKARRAREREKTHMHEWTEADEFVEDIIDDVFDDLPFQEGSKPLRNIAAYYE